VSEYLSGDSDLFKAVTTFNKMNDQNFQDWVDKNTDETSLRDTYMDLKYDLIKIALHLAQGHNADALKVAMFHVEAESELYDQFLDEVFEKAQMYDDLQK
jgi:hypothetical protein